ncbi:PadR family transcriptional regulator [Sporomusa acidovorans]|uniref:Transcription regulator PadR N-terminal domain-containing protein n=1 Tax=Sporomusa acidovorans (strain ATCC 49682 / DSM 3132 / Mol) TaxID=1123286 RepID=A0ABZ3J608_SPOA4|nr:helix-turn-helix transcriptional regulator [Sporomusa acidovorans]OZC18558.1 lineage-specific thermal regulator protein [Sporomusa acidovorans DSM 3132]SDE38301.1 transcriptional regulator, PadR family [Sporomusa acidovorans]
MRINKELLKGSTVILILKLLERKPMYGYEMIKEMENTSGGVFQFKEGTLYPILHSLELDGMLEAYWSDAQGNRQRKYYRLTERGRSQLEEKRREWVIFRSVVEQILGEAIVCL